MVFMGLDFESDKSRIKAKLRVMKAKLRVMMAELKSN